MKIIFPLISIFLVPIATYAKDINSLDEFSRPVIQKIVDITTEKGEKITISQKFLKVGGNELMYIKGSSSPNTLKYGKDLCQSKGQILDIEYGSKLINKNNNYIISCSNDTSLKNNTITKAYSSTPVVQKRNLFTDSISHNESGEKIIQRIAVATGSNGKKYTTNQKFIELKDNKLLYIPNSSSAETIQYANDICHAAGGNERINKGSNIISSNLPFTLSCESKKKPNLTNMRTSNEECNIQALPHSTDGRPNTNVMLSGSFYFSNVTFLNTKISFFDYYNEIQDANLGLDYGNSEIFLNVLAPAEENAYPFTVTGTSQICSKSEQGALAVFQ